jgi:predicted nucleic acid-binding protein
VTLPRRLYWDSCSFLGLLNPGEPKHPDCRAVWDQAKRGEAVLFTSFFAFAEVFKVKCEGSAKPLAEAQDRQIEALLRQSWVQPVLVDERIGTAARRLMRQHPECRKPSDAIHLATALALNVDEMHTYDKSDLLRLDRKVMRADGVLLRICMPYVPAPPAELPIPPTSAAPEQGELQLEGPTLVADDHHIIEWVTDADLEALEREQIAAEAAARAKSA